MQLLIVRHADAGDRETFARTGRPDSERPLSEKGKTQMRSATGILVRLVPAVDVIISSPYARARQTADILRKGWSAPALEESETLEPDARPGAFGKLLAARAEDSIVCVGHEPHLSSLVAWLTTGESQGFLDVKKGGACLVTFDGTPGRGEGALRWLFGPRELAALE